MNHLYQFLPLVIQSWFSRRHFKIKSAMESKTTTLSLKKKIVIFDMIHVVNWQCVTYYLDLCIYCNMISIAAAVAKSLQSCQTLCDPIDGSPPGSSVRGILQARTLEWVAISFSMISIEAIFIRLFDYSMYYCVYLLHCAWDIYSFPTVSEKKKKKECFMNLLVILVQGPC